MIRRDLPRYISNAFRLSTKSLSNTKNRLNTQKPRKRIKTKTIKDLLHIDTNRNIDHIIGTYKYWENWLNI